MSGFEIIIRFNMLILNFLFLQTFVINIFSVLLLFVCGKQYGLQRFFKLPSRIRKLINSSFQILNVRCNDFTLLTKISYFFFLCHDIISYFDVKQ